MMNQEVSTKPYEMTIGLEVHVQLQTKSKIWCGCEITPFAEENNKICEICTGQPGTLPVLNQQVLHFGLMVAKALHCQVNHESYFDRKNYFYPDLPKGYQITQYATPLAQNGYLTIETDSGEEKKIRIERIQIEEDTGKSTHEGNASLINFNRCGTPLLEIVGCPDITSPKEASSYLKKLHSILTYLEVTAGNLQEGNFRCDVNLSIKPVGAKTLGTRTEVKNLNSFKNVEWAIEVEFQRQQMILNQGQKVIQQTLGFDMNKGEIFALRSKSDAHDYRYFAEPDLLPVIVTSEMLQGVEKNFPELPDEKRKRLMSQYEIPQYDAEVLTSSKELANYFEEAAKIYQGPGKKVSNWIMVELLRLMKEFNLTMKKVPVSANELAELLNFVLQGKISGKIAKDVFERMFDKKISAEEAIKEMGLVQINDESALQTIVDQVIQNNPKQVSEFLSGKDKLFGFFVGQVMKESKGQANPEKINELLKRSLTNKKQGLE